METMRIGAVHPTALVSRRARLGARATIGPFTIVHDNVELGDDCIVGAHCVLGEPTASYYEAASAYENPTLTIGPRSVVRSGTYLYAGAAIGADFESGHRVTVREGARIGHHVRIGTHCDVQGHCVIGDYTRLHSHVQVNHRSQVGDFVWLFPYVMLANDPHPPSDTLSGVTIESFAVVAARAVLLPGVRIGRDALVAAGSLVTADVPPETLAIGRPARHRGSVREIRSRLTGGAVYPWRYHFERGMPWEGVGYEEWARGQQPS
jgi:acetyltransferase-like isoleucine patch superfamily enzyme